MQFNHGLQNLAEAFEAMASHLPEDFPPPTILSVGGFSTYAEWGSRDDTSEPMKDAVWMSGSADGVVMNANFREGWPECGASEFDAVVASEWLRALTRDWEKRGSITSSTLRRRDGELRKSA